MMDGFQVGDRVFASDYYHSGTGRIVADDGYGWYGVRFDVRCDGLHDLDGECEFGYGRWYEAINMQFIDEECPEEEDIEVGDLL